MEFYRFRRLVTPDALTARWHGQKKGWGFKCQLCGHRWEVGEYFTMLITTNALGLLNPLICDACDTPDAPKKWLELQIEFYDRFWWAVDNPMGGGDIRPEDLVTKYRKQLELFQSTATV